MDLGVDADRGSLRFRYVIVGSAQDLVGQEHQMRKIGDLLDRNSADR
jgi:hypothetical protein